MDKQYIKIDKYDNRLYYKDREMEIFHRVDGPAIEYTNGSKYWYLDDRLHREDGPAAEYSDGSKHWYLNGERHREDGPAIEYASGSKHWYLNDELHRVDGPAVEYSDGSKEWFLNDKHLTKEEHAKQTAKEVIVSMDEIAKLLSIPVEKLKLQK